jgi:hypothetical protein
MVFEAIAVRREPFVKYAQESVFADLVDATDPSR